MKVLIIQPNQASEFDNALSESNSFVRFHSPQCGHCVAMKEEMEKLKKHPHLIDIDDLNIIDAHTGVSNHSNHPVCNMHDGAVPAMYMIIKGEKPEEYDGDRRADDMARFIGKMIGRKKQTKQSGGIGDAEPAASLMLQQSNNFGTYIDIMGNVVPCKTNCGDHNMGHGLASMVGLGHLTHAKCQDEDGKQHKCKKAQSAGKKRKTRKHKKKAKKAHKKKTHKRKPKRKTRKPKRKTRKHKKKAKKAHKKKTHKRRNVRHSTRKKGGREPHWYQAKRDEYGQERTSRADFVPPDGQGQGRGGEIASHTPTPPCCGKCGSICTSLTCGHSMCLRCGFDGEPTDEKMYCMTPQEIANDKRKRELYRKYQ